MDKNFNWERLGVLMNYQFTEEQIYKIKNISKSHNPDSVRNQLIKINKERNESNTILPISKPIVHTNGAIKEVF